MKIDFVKMNPAGNITAIVMNPVPRTVYGKIAQEIMDPCGLGAEQVGFAERPKNPRAAARLQMMGGEFCGNATRAFAAWLIHQGYFGITQEDDKAMVMLEVSGYEGLINACGRQVFGEYWVSSPMPRPEGIRFLPFKRGELAFVQLPGISHAVVWDQEPTEDNFWAAAEICGTKNASAFGVMFVDSAGPKLVPVVWVKASQSLIWEGSCASGSVAVAAAVAKKEGKQSKKIKLVQPRGTLWVNIDCEEEGTGVRVDGPVKIIVMDKCG